MKIGATDLILKEDGSVFHLGLKPEDISDFIIAVGDPGRVPNVSKHFDQVELRKTNREFSTHTGRIGGKRLSVISTGIGTDNIEIFFNELDALVNVDLKTREPKLSHTSLSVLRIGTSGALQESVPLGSHLLSDYAIGFDNLMTFYNLPAGERESMISEAVSKQTGIPFLPYVVRGSDALNSRVGKGMMTGNTVTCPGFYAPQGRTLRLPIRFPTLLNDLQRFHFQGMELANFEMETAGYFAFGKLLGHQTASVSAIIANRATNQFSENASAVVDSLIRKVLDQV